MIYVVELRTKVEGIGVTQYNEFKGSHKLDERINKWVFEVRKEYGFREMKIESVTVNGKVIRKSPGN
jgi:hypothetical protein